MKNTICCAVLLTLAANVSAAPPMEAKRRARIIGSPMQLTLGDAKQVSLVGPRSGQQLLLTGKYANGNERDLTPFAEWRVADDAVASVSNGYLTPKSDGKTSVIARAGGREIKMPVIVRNAKKQMPVSFRNEVMPVLSSAGCSDIRCHGAPSGKNGFRLSLWGHDPSIDFEQLTRAGLGRRTDGLRPMESLIIRKATGRTPHAGRKRFNHDSHFAVILEDWQAQGMRDDPSSADLAKLTVVPFRRVLHGPARWQQLQVTAHYAGQSVDVTRLASFAVTDGSVATVTREGLVEFRRQGEAAILCRFQGKLVTIRLTYIETPLVAFRWPNPAAHNVIDKIVFDKLKMMNIAPSKLCTDAEFIRRVYLDLCGILPSPKEAREFVASKQMDKRAKLIDRLLHKVEYTEYWTKKWMDVLRVSRDAINLQGAQAYQNWFQDRVKRDAPFDELVRELITSTGKSYSAPATNFFCVARTPQRIIDEFYLQKDFGQATAQLFLGVRLQCAKCHNHPYEQWTQQDYLGLAAFFTEIKRTRLGKAGPKGRPERREIQISLNKKAKEVLGPKGKPVTPSVPGGRVLKFGPKEDRRTALAAWLTGKKNPFFAKAVVNRIWFHLHGRGVVEPVDDFRDSNPPAIDGLLDVLAEEFVSSGYRLRPVIRMILNSRTYQTSTKPNQTNQNDTKYFSHMMARPLPAEVLLDAICEVTAVPEQYEIAKDYTIGLPKGTVKMPMGTRAVQLPVNDIVTLINTNGRYVRYESHPFLRKFGQPNRNETCECDREGTFGRKQALELIVGKLVSKKISNSKNRLSNFLKDKRTDVERLDELYLRSVSRRPSKRARTVLLKYIASAKDKRKAWEDVLWTLLNSKEFIYQH